MLPGKKYTPEEILRIASARKWLLILPLVLTTAFVYAYAKRIPDEYKSETLIMLMPQRVPDSYVKSTNTAKIEDRLASINEQILSRSKLERIIVDLDLYVEARKIAPMEDVVQRMRNDIQVGLEGKESFRVSYINRNGRTAQKVTERLASLFIDENLRDRENVAEDTNQFLDAQLEDAKRRLIEHEKKLEEYRRRFSGQLPSQATANLQAIQNGQAQLQALADSMDRDRDRRLLLERQLGDLQTLEPAAVLPSPANPAQGAQLIPSFPTSPPPSSSRTRGPGSACC